MANLYIGGQAMPEPSACTITREPIWSKNTGRGADGSMVGDIIAYKYKLALTWKVLNKNQIVKLNSAIQSSAFFDVKFRDPTKAVTKANVEENIQEEFITRTMYAGTPTYPVYSWDKERMLPYISGATVDLIEK